MTGPTKSRVNLVVNPAQLSSRERKYYRTTWGFDPVDDCRFLTSGARQYQACFPLNHDPLLQAANITICARVDWQGEAIHNHIVFQQGSEKAREAAVECTHTVVYADPSTLGCTYASDVFLNEKNLPEANWDWLGRTGGPVSLPPWEHFAALKSFVDAVADMGITAMFRSAMGLPDTPFGFNSLMQSQMVKALEAIAPEATMALRQDLTREMLDTCPPDWIEVQWECLKLIYPLLDVFAADTGVILPWIQKWDGRAPYSRGDQEMWKDMKRILSENWEKIIREWPPEEIEKAFRTNPLLDGIQDLIFGPIQEPNSPDSHEIVFGNSTHMSQVKNLSPDVHWETLWQEWAARTMLAQLAHRIGWAEETPDQLEESGYKIPAIKLWPRGSLCWTKMPEAILHGINFIRPRTSLSSLKKQLKRYADYEDPFTPDLVEGPHSMEEGEDHWTGHGLRDYQKSIRHHVGLSSSCRLEDPLKIIRETVRNPMTPHKILEELGSHWDLATRLSIVAHPNATDDLIQQYMDDIQPSVRAIAAARKLRGGSNIFPDPGEILSPGEILWLLVANEAVFFVFAISEIGDKSLRYKKWVRKSLINWRYHSRRYPSSSPEARRRFLGRIFYWCYWSGFFIEPDGKGYNVFHLALDGLRNFACGRFPCVYVGCRGASGYDERGLASI